MAHAQKPDFVFRRNEWVHLSRPGRQSSRLQAAEVCASALVMLDTPRSEVAWEYWLPTPIASFPFTSPPVRHHMPSGFKRTLPHSSILFSTCVTYPSSLPAKRGPSVLAGTWYYYLVSRRILCESRRRSVSPDIFVIFHSELSWIQGKVECPYVLR